MTSISAPALHGLRVVDLTRVLAGPLCTQMLADNGAQVVKIEPPGGDETRHLGPPYDDSGHSAYFAALNRGKKAISLDLSQPAAQEVLHRLLQDADVLVENFLPGTMEKWGLGYEAALAARYPRLIYCAISGFGRDGPLGGLPGYDAVLQAQCGLMSINGESATGATRMGIPIVDHLTGYVALTGILMAVCSRQQSGAGQRVEATLYDTALSLLLPHASNWFASRKAPGLLGSAHPNIAPYDKFRARDGHVFIGILNDGQFRRFSQHIGCPGLPDDARFHANADRIAHRQALKDIIESAIAAHDCEPLCEALMRVGVPAGVVNDVPQALAQAHCAHRQMVIRQGTFTALRGPARLYGTPAVPGAPPPVFSQHADEVLADLGFNEAQRGEMYRRGDARAPSA
ncbi:carnitine dehydratase [Acidovorax sp. Leaf76]|uniref:CaiB/BaiF CoA transferase family protein n=1 Tax=unclassified Acidovorax TaxID=2684926 RepID=UPI0006F48628|nr:MULTISPECIES: CoA transferase [unclassified Acidovorax]KQO15168.1 carnitine dehydratase [Acidovorax sp. Leaf76]KQO31978.1 carnitine dehydratase [Acidovorax sp. Leaf84]KQS29040.1 carnitine dehydratase [Acidovorax sp. Leaf191]